MIRDLMEMWVGGELVLSCVGMAVFGLGLKNRDLELVFVLF
jgi:hypothetical protein